MLDMLEDRATSTSYQGGCSEEPQMAQVSLFLGQRAMPITHKQVPYSKGSHYTIVSSLLLATFKASLNTTSHF